MKLKLLRLRNKCQKIRTIKYNKAKYVSYQDIRNKRNPKKEQEILIRAEIKKHKIVKTNKGISCPFDKIKKHAKSLMKTDE